MLIKKILLPLLLISFSSTLMAKSFKADDAVGFWLSEKEKAIIEIYKSGKEYEGKLVWLIDIHTGKDSNPLDKENPDKKLRKRPMLNLVNMRGFKFDGNKWDDGEIYDPESGKTYSSYFELEDKNTMSLRGYIGVSLFGRSSTWKRQKSNIPDKYLEN